MAAFQIEILERDEPDIVDLIKEFNKEISSKEDYLYFLAFIEEHRAFQERKRKEAIQARLGTHV
jgi:hypothetical protein